MSTDDGDDDDVDDEDRTGGEEGKSDGEEECGAFEPFGGCASAAASCASGGGPGGGEGVPPAARPLGAGAATGRRRAAGPAFHSTPWIGPFRGAEAIARAEARKARVTTTTMRVRTGVERARMIGEIMMTGQLKGETVQGAETRSF